MYFKHKQRLKIGDKNDYEIKQHIQFVVTANLSCSGVSTLFLLP